MLVSASFLSSDFPPNDLKKLNETDVDYIHVDIMDGKFVSNKTMPFREMKNIYKFTDKRLDVHLMVDKPEKYIPLYAELNTEYITFHIEATDEVIENLELIKSYGIKCGLAIKPNTPVKDLVPYLPLLDLVLVMSVEPGMGGQDFIDDTTKKLEELRVLLKEYDSKVVVNVDGGISDKTKDKVKLSDIVTAGSYIIKSDDFQEKIDSLR
ncbi:MAG: ribulose-phosphate 3-epimerase [Bacilli bacterium]|nr:ribulose-phosphate 3-epimerase [Bacilli bacterium]MBR3049035.1 ribulose-phosphate 3-epimerase [Bacilli bacterium]